MPTENELDKVREFARKQYNNVGYNGDEGGLHLYIAGAVYAASQLLPNNPPIKIDEENEKTLHY
jgi:hypothetical protein